MLIKEPKWRLTDLIDWLGGPHAVRDIITRAGYCPPAYETIRGWRWRNSIPTKFLLILIAYAMRDEAFDFEHLADQEEPE